MLRDVSSVFWLCYGPHSSRTIELRLDDTGPEYAEIIPFHDEIHW